MAPLLGADGAIGRLVAPFVAGACRPVRVILFDKSAAANWALGWHQDRVIAVEARHDVPGFGPWTMKSGLCHVQPPFDLLTRMVTARIHLDPVDTGNAPLLVAPGSHRLGPIAEPDIEAVVARCGTLTCTADAGDVWLYATPVLHGSPAARVVARRRVLHVDYAGEDLPAPLRWLMP